MSKSLLTNGGKGPHYVEYKKTETVTDHVVKLRCRRLLRTSSVTQHVRHFHRETWQPAHVAGR